MLEILDQLKSILDTRENSFIASFIVLFYCACAFHDAHARARVCVCVCVCVCVNPFENI